MQYQFSAAEKEFSKDFMYVHSPASKTYKPFVQEKDCLVNSFDEDVKDFDYISVVTKEKFGVGVTATLHCSFEKFGAPLIVLSDDITPGKEGKPTYGLHFEVVAYEDGCNVWHIVPNPARIERPIKPTLIGEAKFPIAADSRITLQVKMERQRLEILLNGVALTVQHEQLPTQFHIGFTACEGINRFYDFTVE